MTGIRLIFFVLLLLVSQPASAALVLTAPPREAVEAGEEIYGPIARELSKVIGEKVVYHHPENWTLYAKEMRAGKYDIVFDGPHFASWRIQHAQHIPAARLSGHLQFYVLSKKSDIGLKKMTDLLGKNFCSLASPNLGTVSAFNLYDNPIIQPTINIVRGGMRNVMRKFLSGECRAAVVRDNLYKKLAKKDKTKIRIIAKSRKMPNQGITLSKNISAKKRQKIIRFLTSEYGARVADNLLSRFSKKKKFFVPVEIAEFNGLNELLEGVVFGW